MRALAWESVELELEGHLLAVLDSGASRSLAESGYNERREECRRAAELLGLDSLRDARDGAGLPEPLGRRVRHVILENQRVDAAVAALEARDPAALGELLDASHASLRDDYEVSVPEVERAVEACRAAGALGRADHGRRLRRLGARAVPRRGPAAGGRYSGEPWSSRPASRLLKPRPWTGGSPTRTCARG